MLLTCGNVLLGLIGQRLNHSSTTILHRRSATAGRCRTDRTGQLRSSTGRLLLTPSDPTPTGHRTYGVKRSAASAPPPRPSSLSTPSNFCQGPLHAPPQSRTARSWSTRPSQAWSRTRTGPLHLYQARDTARSSGTASAMPLYGHTRTPTGTLQRPTRHLHRHSVSARRLSRPATGVTAGLGDVRQWTRAQESCLA
jgi:hypothetical protein